jgi:putative solute:sodium symporter small subunit
MCSSQTAPRPARRTGCHGARLKGGVRVPIEPDRIVQGKQRSRLPLIALAAWALFAFAIPRAAQALNAAKLFGFPLGYLMMALGSFVAMLAVAILSARSQGRIDDRNELRRQAAAGEPH